MDRRHVFEGQLRRSLELLCFEYLDAINAISGEGQSKVPVVSTLNGVGVCACE